MNSDVRPGCISCGSAVASSRCESCGAAQTAGQFRVERVLAQTDHSRTYVAQDPQGQVVALKELLFASVPTVQQLEAFEREAKVLAGVSHPQVPRLVASFREGEGSRTRLYLAQELVQGASLWERLRAGTLDEAQGRQVAAEVLAVLEHLHSRNPPLIHRDIKPHNLIARADGTLALVDFGAARELQGGATHQATLVGTYGYMPPEQLAGTVDQTSDLYALGATLLHLLSGKPPEKLVGDNLELGEGLALNVSPGFERFIRKLAAKTPSKRFSSAGAALAALRTLPVVGGRQRLARPAFLAAGVASVLLVAGVGVGECRPSEGTSTVPDPEAFARTGWTWSPRTRVFQDPHAGSVLPPGSELPIGTEVKADRLPANAQEEGFLRIYAPVRGFLQARDVRAQPPEYHPVFEAARNALAEARLAEAEEDALRAQAIREKEREPLLLLASLYNAQSRPDEARRNATLLHALGPAPQRPAVPETRATSVTPVAGERWFVGATRLRLRHRASAEGRVLEEVPINSELEVLAVSGEWAKVRWTPLHSGGLEFSLGVEGAAPAAPPAVVEGFVAHGFLVKDRLEKQWLLSRAEAALDPEEKARQLGRAAALDPVDQALQLRLARAAVDVRDYPVAALAAVAATELQKGGAVPLVELKLASGCRGHRGRAQFIDELTALEVHAPVDACVETFTAPECTPCDCGNGYYLENERPVEIENRRTQLAEQGVSAEEIEAKIAEEFPDPSTLPSETDRWQEQETARAERRGKVTAAFTDGPWLRVRVTGPARAAPGTQVIVFRFSGEDRLRQDSDGEESNTVCEGRTVEVQALSTVPLPPGGQDVTLWIRVPQYDATYGVDFARSAEEVARRLEVEFAQCGQGTPGNTVSGTPDEARGCDTLCSCT